jgi:hypothetical protein
MVDTVVDNYNKEPEDSFGIYADEPATNAGVGSQFKLYVTSFVSTFRVKIGKYVWGETAPSGTLVAQLFGSNTDVFRDTHDYADGLIAQSTNSIDIDEDLDTNRETVVDFTFNDVELAPGIYFICIFSSNFVRGDSSISVLTTDVAADTIGYMTFWYEAYNRWGSYYEWD